MWQCILVGFAACVYVTGGGLLSRILRGVVSGDIDIASAWRLLIVTSIINVIELWILHVLWRTRNASTAIDAGHDDLRFLNLVASGFPMNRRIWLLVLGISWFSGIILGLVEPF